jgi:hypothetical protein
MNNRFNSLTQLNNSIITGVVHHYWYNNAKPNDAYYFIEWLEIFLNNGSRFIFHRNEESGLIELVNENIAERAAEIKTLFNGKIHIKSIDCSETSWWKEIINNKSVQFIEDPIIEDIPYPETLLIKTHKASMLISPAEEEGIHLELFIDNE